MSLDLKISTESRTLESPGRLFQRVEAAMSNRRTPYDFVHTRGVVSLELNTSSKHCVLILYTLLLHKINDFGK